MYLDLLINIDIGFSFIAEFSFHLNLLSNVLHNSIFPCDSRVMPLKWQIEILFVWYVLSLVSICQLYWYICFTNLDIWAIGYNKCILGYIPEIILFAHSSACPYTYKNYHAHRIFKNFASMHIQMTELNCKC